MRSFLVGLIYENGCPSLTKFLPFFVTIVLLAAFLFVTSIVFAVWLIYDKDWPQYGVFAAATLGGGAAGPVVILGNKVINSIKNSPPLQPFDKNNGGDKPC